MLQVAEFMRQHAGNECRIVVDQGDEFVGEHDAAARQREGIGSDPAAAELQVVRGHGGRRLRSQGALEGSAQLLALCRRQLARLQQVLVE
jgi:hypothetical protein